VRVAFLTNIVSPYRAPVFRPLAETPGWSLRVFVNARSEFDRQWAVNANSFDCVVSRSVSIRRRVRSRKPVPFSQVVTWHLPTGMWGDLRRFRPDVIVSHELGPRTAIAAIYARLHRIPLVIWAYQSWVSADQGSPLRRPARRWLLRQASVLVGMGRQAREVLQSWGAPADRIVDAPNSPDTDTLTRILADPDLERRSAALRERVAGDRRLALVVGRLVPLKGTDAMLSIWRRLDPALRERWKLVFLGDGPLRSLVDDARMDGVECHGHVPEEELAEWYRAADLHVFPTLGDVWGLVVNESMCCSIPSLCSVHAGCADDLIEKGRNGFPFDPTDETAAVQALREALCHPDLSALGRQARITAKRFDLDGLARSFRHAVQMASGQTAHAR
jgi:glycosyltransferase involved in cell wall biosynthesis